MDGRLEGMAKVGRALDAGRGADGSLHPLVERDGRLEERDGGMENFIGTLRQVPKVEPEAGEGVRAMEGPITGVGIKRLSERVMGSRPMTPAEEWSLNDVAIGKAFNSIYDNHNPLRCGVALTAATSTPQLTTADCMAVSAMLVATVLSQMAVGERVAALAGMAMMTRQMVDQRDAERLTESLPIAIEGDAAGVDPG